MFLSNIEVIDHQVPYILRNLVTQSPLKMVYFMKIKYLHCTFIFPANYRLLKDKVFSSDNGFPNSVPKAKKMLKRLGVEYISCHACLNDCILYKDAYVNKERCPKCGHDRYP